MYFKILKLFKYENWCIVNNNIIDSNNLKYNIFLNFYMSNK